jgi:hypothetical protein
MKKKEKNRNKNSKMFTLKNCKLDFIILLLFELRVKEIYKELHFHDLKENR